MVTTEYDEIEPSVSEKGITVSKKQEGKAEKRFAVMNPKTGDLLYELGEYTWLYSETIMNEFYDQIFYVEANGKTGTIDENGNVLIPTEHEKVDYIGAQYNNALEEKPSGRTYHLMAGKDTVSSPQINFLHASF